MINLKAIGDRLDDMDWQHIGDAVDAADAMTNGSAPVPAVYVSTARETAAPNRNQTGRHTQMITQMVSVLFVVGSQRADAALNDDVEERRDQIIERLMGWTPPGAGLPLDYASFSVRFAEAGEIWGELLFQSRYIRTRDA